MLTRAQVQAIQKDGIDWFGKPLKQDGDYGPRTQWWHYISTLQPMRQSIVKTLLRYNTMGIMDDANRSTYVDSFVEPGNLGYGVPWCIALQSYVLTVLGADYPIYHMSAFKLLEWAKEAGRVTTRPLPGDLHCFLYPKGHKLYGSGHGGGVLMPGYSWTAVCDGNVGDTIKVGMRATEGLTFVRTVDDDVQPMAVSTMALERLDGWRDR